MSEIILGLVKDLDKLKIFLNSNDVKCVKDVQKGGKKWMTN